MLIAVDVAMISNAQRVSCEENTRSGYRKHLDELYRLGEVIVFRFVIPFVAFRVGSDSPQGDKPYTA